jgi:ABC-2 type transport system permease protein
MRLRPYLLVARNSLMASLAYRGHFFFSLAGTLLFMIVARFLWLAIYSGGGSIAGMDFSQAFAYVAISTSLTALMRTGADWTVHNTISSGDIVRYLAQPADFSGQILADGAGGAVMSLAAVTIPTFVLAFLISGQALPSLERFLLFLPAVAISFLLNFYIDFLTGLSVFLTQSIGGISTAKETIVMTLSGALVPLAFFPAPLRAVLEWLPFQALYNAPVRVLTDPGLDLGDVLFILMKQGLWLLAFFILSRLLFGAALKRLVVNGG